MKASQRLQEAAAAAKQAEGEGNDGIAAAEWRRYRMIVDTTRNPDDLLSEGVALSERAIELASQR